MTTSYRVVELVRQKISNEHLTASDTDLARVLAVSRTTISAYKHGKTVMSGDTLAKAQEILKLPMPEFTELVLQLAADATGDPSARKLWHQAAQAIGHFTKQKGRAAGWLGAAIVAAGMSFAPAGNQASAANSSVPADIHYAKYDISRSPTAS